MGAGNSTPQTARIDNPNRIIVPIQITPSVVSRLEEAQKLQQECNCSCSKDPETLPRPQEMSQENEIPIPKPVSIDEIPAEEDEDDTAFPPPPPPPPPHAPMPDLDVPEELSDPAPEALSKNLTATTSTSTNTEEIEQFNSTIVKMENIIGKPMAWNENIEREINSLRSELIQCYQDNEGQTLMCANEAKRYQEYIYGEQNRQLRKSETETKTAPLPECRESDHTLPHLHSPPYQ